MGLDNGSHSKQVKRFRGLLLALCGNEQKRYAFRSFPFGNMKMEVWVLQSNKCYEVQFEYSFETWLWLSIRDQGSLQKPSIFDRFSEATIWKWCLRPKNSGVIAQKIASVIHNWCWHPSVDHWSVSSSLRLRNPVAMSHSQGAFPATCNFPLGRCSLWQVWGIALNFSLWRLQLGPSRLWRGSSCLGCCCSNSQWDSSQVPRPLVWWLTAGHWFSCWWFARSTC